MNDATKNVTLFGVDISRFNKARQFFICTCGIFSFYLLYGYYQERIFLIPGFKPHGWFLTLVQFAFYTCFSVIESLALSIKLERRIPMKTYFILAFLTVGTMGMSNASVGYLNYPTQVIFKCCKLIPVMIGGILIQGKRYATLDFISCLCMSVGLTLFVLADSAVQPNFNITGIIMMSLALCSDAAIGNVQEKNMKSFKPSNTEVVLYSYGIGFCYMFVILMFTGSLQAGFMYYLKNPLETYGYSLVFSLTGYLGISFVLTFIRLFGALMTVTVTTCRKALTIIISFTVFSKPFTIQYLWSGCIVLLGIFLNVYKKNEQIMNTKILSMIHWLSNKLNSQHYGKMVQQV
ncbi:adenosine 3'-phospho 5'-phosphosulfate transporter 2-like [Clytia hemisphaerica]